MGTHRENMLNRELSGDTARLWYNEDMTRRTGKLELRLSEEYQAQETFEASLQAGWEPVRADEIGVMRDFGKWLEVRHKDVPDRDQLRREWFDFLKEGNHGNIR